MTTTLEHRPTDEHFVTMAADIGRRAAATDAEHDRDATFVTEAYDAMRETGYLGLAVPVDLGGLGASWRQVVLAQHELARWSGAAALASAMHHYLTLVQRWRHHRDAPGAEAVLRRIADEGIVLATSGGCDLGSAPPPAGGGRGGLPFYGRQAVFSHA